jgi:hypothetical protein
MNESLHAMAPNRNLLDVSVITKEFKNFKRCNKYSNISPD